MARSFNGTTQYLEVDSTPVTSAPFTISVWIRPASTGAQRTAVFVGDSGSGNQYFRLQVDSTGTINWNVRSGGNADAFTSTLVTVNQWHHICAVETASNDHAVFLDGGGLGTSAQDRAPSGANRVSIGRSGDSSPDNFFDGEIGHVAIWNVALSAQQVQSLANGASPLAINAGNLVYYSPVNGQSPEYDIVGQLDLTVTGAPTVTDEPPIPDSIKAP